MHIYVMTIYFQTSVPQLDYDANTQTVDCIWTDQGGAWSPSPISCEPLQCKNPDLLIPSNTEKVIAYTPVTGISTYFETVVNYNCPKNTSIDELVLDEMSFDFSNSFGQKLTSSGFGITQQINLTCGLDE